MDITESMKSIGISESEALDSWEDELATTPEDEVSALYFSLNNFLVFAFIKCEGVICSI